MSFIVSQTDIQDIIILRLLQTVFMHLTEDVRLSPYGRQKYDMTSVDLFEREQGQTTEGRDVIGAHMIYEGKN